MDDSKVVSSFLREYLSDVLRGEVRDRDAYLARFPDHESTIDEELRRIESAAIPGQSDGSSPIASRDGRSFGRYRLLREIGRGGQGVVFLAVDSLLGRSVAIKLLASAVKLAPREVDRFRREALNASRLAHRGICPIFDFGEQDGVPFIVMRFIEGETLAARIRLLCETPAPRPAETARVVRWIESAARALHHAHEHGLVHRDVKPGNILIDRDDEPVLLDFGLSRDVFGENPTLTAAGDLLGTLPYAAPEMLERQARSVDRRADVYSLGVTLYECLTLRRPFDEPSQQALVRRILSGGAANPSSVAPGVPRDLDVVVMTAISVDPDHRYRTCLDFAEDLGRVRQSRPILARRLGPLTRLRCWAKRNRALATAIGACLLLLVAALGWSWFMLAKRGTALAEVRRLADLSALSALEAEADALYPAVPANVAGIENWIERARDLIAREGLHKRRLSELESASIAPDPKSLERFEEERQRDREEFERELDGLNRAHEADGLKREQRLKIESAIAHNANEIVSLGRRNHPLVFATPEEAWEYESLAAYLERLDMLKWPTGLLAGMDKRLSFARGDDDSTLKHWEALWDAAHRRIADRFASPAYGGLRIEPQVGLIPLGPDPSSGLEEFAHVQSGAIPLRGPAGRLEITEETGIVFVLLPGGRFSTGASPVASETEGGRRDPHASRYELPGAPATLAPFFVAKFEMSQRQWMNLSYMLPNDLRSNPSIFAKSSSDFYGNPITDRHPVENVSLAGAFEALKRVGLRLPTEAQWEYAARADTDGVWSTGDEPESLSGAANVADEAFAALGRSLDGPVVPWNDGYATHAPIGFYEPNAFGLHDVHGNVAEWCLDEYYDFSMIEPRDGDGLRALPTTYLFAIRGGSFASSALSARSACRRGDHRDARREDVGIRPVRPLEGP